MSLPCAITISCPAKVRVGEPFVVSGALTDLGGVPIANALIHVYAGVDNEIGSVYTSFNGTYSVPVAVQTAGRYDVYTRFLGNAAFLSAGSMVITVTASADGNLLSLLVGLAAPMFVGAVLLVGVSKRR